MDIVTKKRQLPLQGDEQADVNVKKVKEENFLYHENKENKDIIRRMGQGHRIVNQIYDEKEAACHCVSK